jgi:hypothetical protein
MALDVLTYDTMSHELNVFQKSTPDQPTLDRLVAFQLEAIAHREAQLEKRYSKLLETPNSPDWQNWASDLWNLRLQTDRLGRLLDAI